MKATIDFSSVTEAPGHHEIIAGVHVPGPIIHYFPNLELFWDQFKVVILK